MTLDRPAQVQTRYIIREILVSHVEAPVALTGALLAAISLVLPWATGTFEIFTIPRFTLTFTGSSLSPISGAYYLLPGSFALAMVGACISGADGRKNTALRTGLFMIAGLWALIPPVDLFFFEQDYLPLLALFPQGLSLFQNSPFPLAFPPPRVTIVPLTGVWVDLAASLLLFFAGVLVAARAMRSFYLARKVGRQ